MASSAPLYERHPFPATERDLDDLPEDVTGEILDGELIVHPRPDPPHTQAASGLGFLLGPAFHHGFGGGPGGWILLVEPKIRFGADLLVPDLAGWRRERFIPIRKGPYTVAPDWICELLSPSTARTDRVRKLPVYAREGVSYAWILDPTLRTLEALRLRDGKWLILGVFQKADKVRVEPFEALELDLSLLWENLPPDPEEEEREKEDARWREKS
jgi:Uma2 family endonuclease